MKNTVYCLGNSLVKDDNLPIQMMPYLKKELPQFLFRHFDPTETDKICDRPIFVDTILGSKKITIYSDLSEFQLSPRVSAHDYDLPLFLGLMIKLSKIKNFTLIGIPNEYTLKRALKETVKVLRVTEFDEMGSTTHTGII